MVERDKDVLKDLEGMNEEEKGVGAGVGDAQLKEEGVVCCLSHKDGLLEVQRVRVFRELQLESQRVAARVRLRGLLGDRDTEAVAGNDVEHPSSLILHP